MASTIVLLTPEPTNLEEKNFINFRAPFDFEGKALLHFLQCIIWAGNSISEAHDDGHSLHSVSYNGILVYNFL